tara:strand:+ start:1233 stop:2399 length:1167 start_codon:yes stop_codon:yes gene_type:complete
MFRKKTMGKTEDNTSLRAALDTMTAERDGYKGAYEIQTEEVNAQRGLIMEYQRLYSELAGATRPPPRPLPPQTSDRHFLILSNGRTGSTWLVSSLNQLPDVRAYRQIGWRLGDQPDHAQRFSINRADSMKVIIDAACYTKEPLPLGIAGSKFVFQPYTYTHASVARELSDCIEDDIRLLHLKRSYLSTFLSWKTRGVAHSIDPQVAATQRVRGALEDHQPDAEPQHIVLTSHGRPLADTRGAHYPIKSAIDDMLVMFTNDLFSRAIVSARGGLILDYADITTRFGEIARFIGSAATDETIASAIARPLTRKLAALTEFLHPIEPFSAIADCLDRAFHANAGDEVTAQPDGSFRLKVNGLKQALINAGAHAQYDGDDIIWWPHKPVMKI